MKIIVTAALTSALFLGGTVLPAPALADEVAGVCQPGEVCPAPVPPVTTTTTYTCGGSEATVAEYRVLLEYERSRADRFERLATRRAFTIARLRMKLRALR